MTSPPAIAKRPPPPAGERRLLRVGIIQGARIVEERVLRDRGAVSIGSSPRATFIVPSERLPARWRLFEERRGRRYLRLGADMTARIAGPPAAAGAAATADPAAVVRVGGGGPTEPARSFLLPDGARGRVTVGDTTVLFQLVRPPPAQPRPRLPHSVRRRALDGIDKLFAIIFLATLVGHVAMVVYLRQVDWPRRPPIEELPDRFIHQIAHRPPPAPKPTTVATAPSAPRAPAPAPAPRPPRAPAPPAAPQSEAERRAELEKRMRGMGLLKVLPAPTEDGHSAVADLLAPGGVDRPFEEAMRGVRGIAIADNDGLRGLPGAGSGQGHVATPGSLRGGPGIEDARGLGPTVERRARPVVEVDRPALESGRADPAAIAAEVRARRKAIAACYERALKLKPTLAGKLVLRFTITAAGTVSAAEVDDDSLGAPEVAGCVRALVLRWRFTPPAEAPVELSFPFLFQSAD
jgi:outer membrane biosynthesis protein TonB